MTNQEAAEKIEDMFDAQLDETAMHDALDRLQIELIGEVAVEAMRDRRHREYMARPSTATHYLTTQEICREFLNVLSASMEKPKP